ncbi:hypothetical protein EDD36DRAFT_61237 [Exophiala viscosa]|uniref:Uncharacterized protein n=1 Tax=Exophiala viscosa TaxID=2486360 RepID=A0AAN6DR63_9EURO|nr:hypothetical protein EDD36DRAFT_61237 [Exophiala viscosa]
MVAITTSLCLTAIVTLSCLRRTEAARRFDRRSDLDDVPPVNVSTSGWTVPLHGGTTCDLNGTCTDSLTAPPGNKPLQYLAVARGVYTWTCTGGGPSEKPVFQSQSTQLYNAAPLVTQLASEAAFHALIPQLCDYDYAQLENSTLECMGTIGTINNTAIVTLFEIATFAATSFESILAPNDPEYNGPWGHSISPRKSWDVYRVEVAGGAPPLCGSEKLEYSSDYAAEYWFFHAGREGLWADINVNITSGRTTEEI